LDFITYNVLYKAGVPNLGDASPWGDARGSRSVISWVHLYQWGDAEAKRLGTSGIKEQAVFENTSSLKIINFLIALRV
jgi:hypothetical protein